MIDYRYMTLGEAIDNYNDITGYAWDLVCHGDYTSVRYERRYF